MKRYLYIISLSLLLAGCDYNERNFEGLDELSRPANVYRGELAIAEADLPAVIAALNALDIPEKSNWAAALNRDKAFSDDAPAESILPWYLRSLYYGADAGSSVDVTYDRKKQGNAVLLEEDFEDYTEVNATIDLGGWSQYRENDTYFWQAKNFDGWFAQIANGPSGQKVTWLISPEIDLADASDPQFSFDVKVGYYTASCLEIKVGTDYTGGDPTATTWTDITSSLSLPVTPPTGYGTAFEPAGPVSLADYAGEKVRVAFRYNGDADASPKRTTTYQLDNIRMGETGPRVESVTGQFILSETGWMFDPTYVHTLDKADYQVVVDYVLRTHAASNPALVHANSNAEYYYGFAAYYGNVTYRESDRSKDTAYPAAGTAEEKAAFMNARTIEGLCIFLAETMPHLTPEVNGIEQLAHITVSIFSDPLSDRQNVVWTYTLRCTAPGEWAFVERCSDGGTIEPSVADGAP